jgi:uncharacterized protein YjiK
MNSNLRLAVAAVALSILPAAAQSFTLNLSQYVQVGRYDLPEPSRDPAPSGSLLAQEASAVTFNTATGTLFVVGDGGTSVVQVSKTGALIDSMTLAADATKPRGRYFDDPEGIVYISGGPNAGKFVIIEERTRVASLFTYAPNTTLGIAEGTPVKLGTTIGNVGIEGMSYDPFSGGFIGVKELNPMGIFQTTMDFSNGTASNGSASTVNSVNLFDPALLGVTDIADVYSLSNVLPSESPQYGHLLVLSQENGRLVHVDRSGNIIGTLDLGIPPQHEGVAMDSAGNIYVVSELGGAANDSDLTHPQLWVYAPVPEPEHYAMVVGIGALAFGILRRQRPA